MTLYLVDVAEYQSDLSVASLKAQGFVGLMARCVIGDYQDPTYPYFRDEAKRLGLLFGAYVFPHTDVSWTTHVALTKQWIGDPTIPIMIDWEGDPGHGARDPNLADAVALRDALVAAGLSVKSLYTYGGYWSSVGGGDLNVRDWALVSANYGGNPSGYASAIYPGDTSARWGGFGNKVVSILQFGSNIQIDGYGRVDGDAYRGTLDQLKATGIYKDWTGDDMPTAEEIATAVWGRLLSPNGKASEFLVDAKNAAVAAKAATDTVEPSLAALKAATDTVEPSLAALKTAVAAIPTTPVDQAALERAVVAAVEQALAGGVPAGTVKAEVQAALAEATIPVVLAGHAGIDPVIASQVTP